MYLNQWFLALLEILNPTNFISTVTETFMQNIIFSFKTQFYVLLVHTMNSALISLCSMHILAANYIPFHKDITFFFF